MTVNNAQPEGVVTATTKRGEWWYIGYLNGEVWRSNDAGNAWEQYGGFVDFGAVME